MKVKLDENLHIGLVEVFTPGNHDVETVADEGLLGADDATVEGGRRRGPAHHHP